MLNNSTPFYMPVAPSNGNNNGNGFWNGDGIWAVIIFALIFGWGGNGIGGFGGGQGSAVNYTLASDFATIQRQLSDGFNSINNALDTQNTGICNLGYTNLELTNQTNMNMMNGFNQVQAQLADCCCKTGQDIKDTQYAIATTGAGIQGAIKDCCCETDKQFMQTRYDNAQANCATLTAIDKLGDRIIGYMDNQNTQNLRDENFALKLAASQASQNNFIQNLVKPPINPCYVTQNPYCSCGNAHPYGFGYGYGTTIA